MTYEDAIEATVSLNEAISELEAHGQHVDHDGPELFDCQTGETIALANADGEFNGGDILAWLGY